MKKVLFILHDLGSGGSEKVFVNLANGFVANGLEVDILLGKNEGVYFNILNPKIKVHTLHAKSVISYFLKLPFFLRNQYTHIFTENDITSAATVFSKFITFSKAKVVVTLHYHLPFFLTILPLKNKIFVKFLNKYFITKADKIIAVSKGVAEGFCEVTGASAKKLSVIYNPIYDDTIYKNAQEPLQNKFDLNNDCLLINMGNLILIKDHITLINAFNIVKAKITNAKLLLLGEGELENNIKQHVQSLHLQDDVIFFGFIENPFNYLAASKLLISSSISEGFCNVLVEALALGINVVSTDCLSGPAEILENGKYGWLSTPKDAEALAANVLTALKNPLKPSILKDRAKIFHCDFIVKQYLSIL